MAILSKPSEISPLWDVLKMDCGKKIRQVRQLELENAKLVELQVKSEVLAWEQTLR
jgi:hypothetical protein